MRIHKICVGQLEVNCYIVADERSDEAIIIDPGDEFERIAELIDSLGIKPTRILFTHAHYDHVCAGKELQERYRCDILMHEDENGTYETTKGRCVSWGYEPEDFPPPDIILKDHDRITLGNDVLEVIHSPGHSPGSICLYIQQCLFTGDTLFRGSVGRTDLAGGNTEKLMGSIKRLMLFPPDTKVFCGHGPGTTIGEEKAKNPFIRRWFGTGDED